MIRKKNIFITGGAGFIANTLIKYYIDHNQITVYDNFHRDTLSGSGLAKHPNIKIIKGDVLDLPFLTKSMKGAEIVVHAAGIAGIDTVIKDPVKTMTVNMIGTANQTISIITKSAPESDSKNTGLAELADADGFDGEMNGRCLSARGDRKQRDQQGN